MFEGSIVIVVMVLVAIVLFFYFIPLALWIAAWSW